MPQSSVPASSRPRALFVLGVALVVALTATLATRSSAAPAEAPFGHIPFSYVGAGVEAFPGNGQTVAPQASTIFIRLAGESALQTGAQIVVSLDDRDISATCRRQDSVITFPLPPDLAPGPHRVSLALPSLMSGTREIHWQFTVAPPSSETGTGAALVVTHSAKRTLYEGDLIEVRVEAPPGGRGTATIGPIRLDLGEVEPGVYTANREVVHDDYCVGSPIQAELSYADGRVLRASSSAPLKIFGQVFTVRIITPQSGQRVPWDFLIKGRTRPNSLITITPMIGGGSTPTTDLTAPPAPGSITRNIGTIQTSSDARGYFTQKFGFPIRVMDIAYGFKVTAIDPQGAQAIPATFRVVLGARKAPPSGSPSPAPAHSPSPTTPRTPVNSTPSPDWTR